MYKIVIAQTLVTIVQGIVSLALNYVEKLTEDDTAPEKSPLLPPPHFI